MYNDELNEFEENLEASYEELEHILNEYNKRQAVENMTGPGVSMFAHIVLLTLMFIFIVAQPKQHDPIVKITLVEEKVVELQPEIEEEFDEITEDVIEDPVVAPTDAPSDDMVGTESALVDVSDEAPMTDDNSEAMEYMDFVDSKSALTMPLAMGGRTKGGREGLRKKHGGSKEGARSVNRALRWLASVQNEDGSWGDRSSAHTGLALLVFLGHGETPLSETYGKTVQTAMRWLANYANQEDLARKVSRRPGAYSHGIATYAISESYAMTKIPTMQTAMEKAVAIVIDGQQSCGGFDYGYKKGERTDMSVAGWNFQAMKAARVAGSSNPDLPKALRKSIKYLCSKGFGTYQFEYAGGKPKPNMQGIGTVCLQLLGGSKRTQCQSGMSYIAEKRLASYREVYEDPSKWNKVGGENLYGHYYDTMCVFNNMKQPGGKALWKQWKPVFERVLIKSQNSEGYWETDGQHGIGKSDTPGRVLSTCLAALQLEVYYRYLPSFDITKMNSVQDGEDMDKVGEVENGLVIEID